MELRMYSYDICMELFFYSASWWYNNLIGANILDMLKIISIISIVVNMINNEKLQPKGMSCG
ncbi:MAG: hypothetical protein GX288_05690 [Clostridiales bacterium]|nr:hypothetical protein [Clostridiales bacterium]